MAAGELMRHLSKIFLISVILFVSAPSWACRFWVAVGDQVPTKMILDDLLEEPYSLYKLADEYPDGWSVGYYNHGEEIFVRRDSGIKLGQAACSVWVFTNDLSHRRCRLGTTDVKIVVKVVGAGWSQNLNFIDSRANTRVGDVDFERRGEPDSQDAAGSTIIG